MLLFLLNDRFGVSTIRQVRETSSFAVQSRRPDFDWPVRRMSTWWKCWAKARTLASLCFLHLALALGLRYHPVHMINPDIAQVVHVVASIVVSEKSLHRSKRVVITAF
jgi:hypothetical protein